MTSPTVPSSADLAHDIEGAMGWLAQDGLVAFPTETVWGIAADARSDEAVEALRRFKGRDPQQPISLLVDGPSGLAELGCTLDSRGRALAEAFWPGPLTLVLPCRSHSLVAGLAGPGGGIGIRCSSHPVAQALARAASRAGLGPLTATSCNLAGEPPAGTREQARRVCAAGTGAPRVIEAGADACGARPSSVLDLCTKPSRLLREGAIDARALRRILPVSRTSP